MNSRKVKQSLTNLGNAIMRLKEAIESDHSGTNSLVVDATIQRFEFVIELYWKTFKRILAYEGIETSTPREALQQAYSSRFIDNETLWLQFLKNRNATSHIYDEDTALRIFHHIQKNFEEFEQVYRRLMQRYEVDVQKQDE
ncbi:hypothetical protein PAE9249_04238 [Paenibacillus sp. CECT 9249]|uniref:HI0074 family nucleotidyltransferase substrate-binding subunit n=1 Tax=Paenibacillus sp. CECT 9249 TaxID=2845385 RepID=UPI001E2C9EA6|nr:HI0074 family nucleotidyltransferase substrate-binding subunit [Paenibacillus sp. CECT 9249]CAH0121705.1 hypothetical protein PAE9249_04238 [Paenibacillus sp. CECT 9249]